MNNDSPLEELNSKIYKAVSSVFKAHYIENFKNYRADYSNNSLDAAYHAYIADNFLYLVNSAIIAGIKAYHNALSDELLDHGIDIGQFIFKSDVDDLS